MLQGDRIVDKVMNNPNQPRIILTGGGTGGHISPLLAVAHEIKKHSPSAYIIYVGEHGGKFAHMLEGSGDIDESYTIFAGKFRRYNGESWLFRLFDVRTNFLNFRDVLYVLIGLGQSLRLVKKLNPDILLLKGGFVGVPVGIAAGLLRKKFITHDSDSMPGLANRIVSRWATYHATAMPPEYYPYPSESVRQVGVLVSAHYERVTPVQQKQYKINLQLSPGAKVLLVTGGSLGARQINLALVKIAPDLIKQFPGLEIVHQVGKGNIKTYGLFSHPRLHVVEFMKPMYEYTGAADLVVSRAGANTLAELGVQGKPVVVVPNPRLTGGHQLKNAEFLNEHKAAFIVDEEEIAKDPSKLIEAIGELLNDNNKRAELGANLQKVTIPDAASRLAKLLIETAAMANVQK